MKLQEVNEVLGKELVERLSLDGNFSWETLQQVAWRFGNQREIGFSSSNIGASGPLDDIFGSTYGKKILIPVKRRFYLPDGRIKFVYEEHRPRGWRPYPIKRKISLPLFVDIKDAKAKFGKFCDLFRDYQSEDSQIGRQDFKRYERMICELKEKYRGAFLRLRQ